MLRDISEKNWPIFFKNVIIIKEKRDSGPDQRKLKGHNNYLDLDSEEDAAIKGITGTMVEMWIWTV